MSVIPLSAQAKTFSQRLFNETFYLSSNPDVLAAVSLGLTTAFEHFSTFGHRESRPLLPFFDTQAYLLANPDVLNATTDPGWVSAWNHFVLFGILEGRSPNGTTGFTGLFDDDTYLAQNADVSNAVSNGDFRNGFEHYLLFGAKEGRAAVDKGGNAIDFQSSVMPGKTFTLTTGSDIITGTSGNDTIFGTDSTLNLFDVIDGGKGNDTLNIFDAGSSSGVSFNPVTIKNVENLIYQAANNQNNTLNLFGLSGLQSVTYQDLNSTAKNVTINTKGNATSVTVKNADAVTVTDTATTDTLASVSIDGNSGAATITSDALTSLSLANTGQNATVTAAAGTRTLNVTLNNVTGAATIQDNNATAVAITGSSKASDITLTAGAATSLSFAGDAAVKLAAAPLSVTSITSTNTAGVTITTVLGSGVSFTGGDGNDKVTVGATTKTIDMGKGNDTVIIDNGVSALGPGGSLKGGDGIDTISMDADDVAAATLTPTFANSIDGFERLDISSSTATAAVTVNLANLDNIADVRVSATINQDLTLNNLATNGTVTWTAGQAAGKTTTINVAGAVSNPNDVINLAISSQTLGINAQTVIVANVETVNLNTDDSAATPTGIVHTLTLTAAHAKTLTVFGDAGVTLTLTGSTALETINTSGVTKGAVDVTIAPGTGNVTLIGGDTDTTFDAFVLGATKSATITTGAGNDTIIGGAGNDIINAGNGNNTIDGGAGNDIINAGDGNDTIIGGAGDDIINAGNGTNFITGGGGKDIMTGGTGVDTYIYTAVTDSQGTNIDIITNFQVGAGGDVIDVSAISVTPGQFLGIANGYGAVLTALVNDNKTNAVFDSSTSTLYIDVDGDAALTSADMAIQLAGVTSGLVAANFIL